jgi:hypothetical protein
MIKSLKRKSGISVSRVAVRPQTPPYVRWVVVAVLTLLALALSWAMYDAGRNAGFDKNDVTHELDRLSRLNADLQRDNDELHVRVAGLDRQLQMDLVAREDISKQVKTLEHENTRLKEDLAFFQNLGSAPGKNEPISIGRLKLERGNFPGEYRYSLLLVQGKQRPGDFHGTLEFTVNFQQNGEKMAMPLADSTSKTEISFKFYQRVENVFRMPPDAIVESMEVKVFEKGVAQPKLVQTVNLSL